MRLLIALVLLSVNLTAIAADSVSAKFMANREEIKAGEPFLIGLQLTMHDHWHTYWENPGFAGQAPSLKLDAIPGLTVGPLQFPWPKRWQDGEGYVSFGYDKEVLIWATAVYQGGASQLAFNGSIEWIACKESCIPGSAKFQLNLKLGQSKPANQAVFDQAVAATPLPYNAAMPFTFEASLQLEKERWSGTLKLHPKPGQDWAKTDTLTLFPLPVNELADLKTALPSQVKGDYLLSLTYEAYDSNVPADLVIAAAVKINTEQGPLYVRLPLYPSTAVAQAQAAGAASATSAPASGVAPVPASGEGSSAGPDPDGGAAAVAPEAVPVETTEPAPEQATSPASGGLWYYIMLAFLGGLILNLMPCVLPVLSLKVFSLLQDAGKSSVRRLAYGWVYTLGIMVSFNIISGFFIAAKAAGKELGIGFQFQSPEFVIAISLVLFVMALSFMGVFHFGQLNSQKLNNLSMKSGYQGAFFQGALMTLLSTPCTAPMLGAAYGWALSQSTQVILIIFNLIAFGLAFPYLLLCYAPALLRFMPKPGAWMEHFKVAMGFLLMGTLVWLIYILGDLTGSSGVTGTLAFLLAVGAACLIFGKSWYSPRRAMGIAAMVAITALGVYVGLFRLFDIRDPKANLNEQRNSLRLEYLSAAGMDKGSLFSNMVTSNEKIAWIPYSDENLEYYRAQNRLVFVDFTATWCATCKLNERTVIDTQKIRELFASNQVVCMKADYTDKSDHLTRVLKSFNRAGVPMYLVYPGKSEALLLPELITRDIVSEAVDEAKLTLSREAAL